MLALNRVILSNKLNNAINSNTSEEDNEDNKDFTIDYNYYSLDEFTSAKFNSSKTFSIVHLNIHSIEKHTLMNFVLFWQCLNLNLI